MKNRLFFCGESSLEESRFHGEGAVEKAEKLLELADDPETSENVESTRMEKNVEKN